MNAFLTNDVIVCISKFPQTKFYINEKSLEENLVLFINSKYYIINKFVGWKHLFKVFTNKCKIIYALSYALSQLILWNVSSYYYSFGTGSWECALFYFQGFFFCLFQIFHIFTKYLSDWSVHFWKRCVKISPYPWRFLLYIMSKKSL